MTEHSYCLQLRWTGNIGSGTNHYGGYKRDYTIDIDEHPTLLCSSDPAFRGDCRRYNPEELLLGALSGCHMLWYLSLCAESGVIVSEYEDRPIGLMHETKTGEGEFHKVILRPRVVVMQGSLDSARTLHSRAAEKCFIARSVNFPVEHEPTIIGAPVDDVT